MMYEDLRSKMMAFCDKTNNDKDCHEIYYEYIDDLFRKDLKQYIDRVYNVYLSRLRTIEFFFNKYNGKYSKETITSSKRAQELYDKIVDYFPNNKFVTELGKTLQQKSTPKTTPVEHKQYNLRPLISKREKELNEMKKRELIELLPAKLKSSNKKQLVNEVFKKENIQVGVKGLENWEYQDLQTAHKCLESLKDYKQKVNNLKTN